MQCMSFSAWLIPLKIVSSKFIYVAANNSIYFFFLQLNSLPFCIYHIFVHFSADGHLGWFRTLAIVTSAALNMGAQVSLLHTDFISFECMPNSEIAASYCSPIFNFVGNLYTAFHNMYTNLHSYQQCKSLFFSEALPILVFLIITILTGMRWYIVVVLICISLIMSDVEHFFHIPGYLCMFFQEMFIQVFCPLLSQVTCSNVYCLVVLSYLCILD